MNPLLLLLLGGGGYVLYKRHQAAKVAPVESSANDQPPQDMGGVISSGGAPSGVWQPPSPVPSPPAPAPPSVPTRQTVPTDTGPNAPNAFGFTPLQYRLAALAWCRAHGLSATQAHVADCIFAFAQVYGDFDHYNGNPGGGKISTARPPSQLRLQTALVSSARNVSGIGKI